MLTVAKVDITSVDRLAVPIIAVLVTGALGTALALDTVGLSPDVIDAAALPVAIAEAVPCDQLFPNTPLCWLAAVPVVVGVRSFALFNIVHNPVSAEFGHMILAVLVTLRVSRVQPIALAMARASCIIIFAQPVLQLAILVAIVLKARASEGFARLEKAVWSLAVASEARSTDVFARIHAVVSGPVLATHLIGVVLDATELVAIPPLDIPTACSLRSHRHQG